MSDVNVLYIVAGVVIAALLVWAGVVLATAEDAPDESKPPSKDKPTDRELRRVSFEEPPKIRSQRPPADETPPPATVDVTAPSERAVAIAGKSAPVVILPVMRQRLDSHSEISDDGGGAPDAEPPAEEVDWSARESVMPSAGPPLHLVSAMGRSEPTRGPTEMSAIVDRHRLFILADGGGQRVQNELVSAVLVDALAAAFEADAGGSAAPDPALPRRGNRLRHAVLTAFAKLQERGKGTELDEPKVHALAAHFSPDNRTLYVATSGPDRAYRLRGAEVVHLNRPRLSAPVAGRSVDSVVAETNPGDVYVFGSDAAFLALGDELRSVLTSDTSIERVAAHFVAAATREGQTMGVTAIVVRVDPPRHSQRPSTV